MNPSTLRSFVVQTYDSHTVVHDNPHHSAGTPIPPPPSIADTATFSQSIVHVADSPLPYTSVLHPISNDLPPPKPVISPTASATDAITTRLQISPHIPTDIPVVQESRKYHGLMWPTGPALRHPAAGLLLDYASNGCPVDCGRDWSQEEILAALRRGPHPSARQPDAARELHREVREKVNQGYAKIVKWKDIRHNPPTNLKLSPVAQIPHKSRSFRTILDLSYALRHKGTKIPSVNSSTALQAPEQSMSQLGVALTRFVQKLADNYDPKRPFAFVKFDIKDGFWRMAVHPDNAWHFAYVLPPLSPNTPDDELEIVVPFALQMGWCESPPLFGTASETARDVTESLKAAGDNPPHPLETLVKYNVPPTTSAPPNIVELLEVYVDDFFAGTNDLRRSNLIEFTRALLHGIHSCFPPPNISGHSGEDPVSVKKILNGEGAWQFRKEILGWIIDGEKYTINLTDEKRKKYVAAIKAVLRKSRTPAKDLEKVVGKLGHVALGVPAGKGLLTPLYRAQAGNPSSIATSLIRQPLEDWIQLLHAVTTVPTDVRELTPGLPDYIEYNDASKWGAGGVLWGPNTPFMVWRVAWPDDVRAALNTPKEHKHRLAINDLELAALVLG